MPEETIAIRTAGFENGIIFGLGGVDKNVLKIKPPLIVNKAECDEILDKFRRGIGASIVRNGIKAGAKVSWTYSGSAAGKTASEHLSAELPPDQHSYLASDCTDADSARNVFEQTIKRWGKIDCLVYNAGLTNPKPMLEISAEEWRRYVDLNLSGAFISCRDILKSMAEQSAGSIVLIGSAAVATGGGGRADYISAKAGLETMAKAITKEFAGNGIRCNVVHPSLIMTDLLKERYPNEIDRKSAANTVPAGRLGTPDDIAYVTLFLLSDMASYISGQAIFVDGGRTFCK